MAPRLRCDGGSTADARRNMLNVSAVPPRRSGVLTVFGGATAINDGTTAELRRSWRCHCGLCRKGTSEAPRIRCDGGINLVHWDLKKQVIVVNSLQRLYPRDTGGAVPLRFFCQNRHHCSDTASIFSLFFPYPSRPSTAVEPPRDSRRVASLLFRDCTAVL